MRRYVETSVPDQNGKTFFVTGANTGIGYEAARVLAARGARVLLGCRSQERAEKALERIRRRVEDAEVEWIPIDLASLASVQQAAEQVAREPRLDGLINNAGVMVPPKTLTEDGFELQFGVNHLAHFALTGLLLDTLAATPDSRIVTVSSLAHRSGFIDFDDPHAERGYRAITRYQMSKAANLYFTFELARRLERAGLEVTAVACHPGIADTELARTVPAALRLWLPVFRPWFNSPAEGALPTLMAATMEGALPTDYFGPIARGETARSAGPARVSSHVRDEQVGRRLWELSVELTGVDALPEG